MIYLVGGIAYLSIAAAQSAALEKIFADSAGKYTEQLITLASLVWPLTAPLLTVYFAAGWALEKLEGKHHDSL